MLGWKYAIPVGVIDMVKGAAPVVILGPWSNGPVWFTVALGLAAVLGHMFSPYVRFRGGKGVATAAGVFLVLSPLACLGAVILFLLVVIFWRYVSLGSVSAAAAMPLLIYFLWAPRHAPPLAVTVGALAAALLILYKHRGNLERLREGAEPRFSFSKNKEAE